MRLFNKTKEADSVEFQPHFPINDAIRLQLDGEFHSSRVEDVANDSVWVSWPATYGINLRLGDTSELKVISSIQTGMQGYRARIIERREGPPAQLRVVPYEALGKVQRRNYVRVADTQPLKFWVLEGGAQRGEKCVETTTRNISGGGLLVNLLREDRPLPGDRLELELQLPGHGPIRVKGSAIRIDPLPNVENLFEMALRFTDIQESDIQLIIRRVYTREAELRRAGIL